MMFCENCGRQMPETVKFCPACGAANPRLAAQQPAPEQPPYAPAPEQPPQYQQAQPYAPAPEQPPQYQQAPYTPAPEQPPQYQQAQPYQQPAKKASPLKLAVIIAVAVLLLGGGGFAAYRFFLSDKGAATNAAGTATGGNSSQSGQTKAGESGGAAAGLPDVNYTYADKKPEAVIEFTTVDSIFPSSYRSLPSIAEFTGYSDYGDLDVLIEVEVPGFTQPYKQKVTLSRQVTKLRIVPPLVTGSLDLSSEKTAQLVYSVVEVDSGKLLVQESKNIRLFSKFDMVWGDDINGDAFTDNILAWMTPDAPEITALKRGAIDYLAYVSDGALDSLVGYQDYNYFSHIYYNTWVQAVAIQGAMSDVTQVRYNHSGFSMDAQQRVKLPAETLNTRSGICIETSLVMASALQSSGMHVMLIFPPGHAQVAVEAWPYSGDYFLIETTALPMAQDEETWDEVVLYLTQDEWWGYLSGDGEYTYGPCYVLDCDLGAKLGIRAMSN